MKNLAKILLLGICFSLLTAFVPVVAEARPHCGKVWVHGHRDRHGRWIRPHWKHLRWVPGHYNRHGMWVPGRCR